MKSGDLAFVYHHVPKCGGTSLLAALYRWFAVIPDYEDEFESEEAFLARPVETSYLHAAVLLTGHWNRAGSRLPRRYPDLCLEDRLRIFTVVREPLELRKSLFYYTRKTRPELARANPLFQSLRNYVLGTRNLLAKELDWSGASPDTTLERYFFVGVTEKLDETIRLLWKTLQEELKRSGPDASARRMQARLSCLPPLPAPHLNRAVRDAQDEALSPEDIERFHETNALDYHIYSLACARFEHDGERLT